MLVVAILPILLISLQPILAQCLNTPLRREITEMTQNERNRLIAALRQLHNGNGSFSTFDNYSRLHQRFATDAHGQPQFLPWHRRYIRNLELDLQRIDPEVTLAYWDWTRVSSNPAMSIIFNDINFGGSGDPNNNYCVGNGMFSNLSLSNPNPKCLQRQFDINSGTISPVADSRLINFVLDNQDFNEFSQRLEVLHGNIHVGIGGNVGDMTYMYSPNDPLFYLHHSFIDYLWYAWQQRHGNEIQYNGIRDGRMVRMSDIMEPFGVSVQSTMSIGTDDYCYSYAGSWNERHSSTLSVDTPQFQEKAKTQSKAVNIPALNDKFIAMNKMNRGKVRAIEDEFKRFFVEA